MATVVVPFRSGGKSRLPVEIRIEVALAMLGDVLEAAVAYAESVRLVTDDAAAQLVAGALHVEVVPDPGGGQGRAVQAALAGIDGICLVVNSDLPRARPSDLAALAIPAKAGAVAIAAAADDTTNALGLPYAEVFQPLYGPRQRVAVQGARGRARPRPSRPLPPEPPRRRRHARRSGPHRLAGGSAHACGRCAAARVRVVLLSGGVGGAKLAAGLHDVLAPGELTVIGNVGDDLEVLGLYVSPDLDSVLYALAGLNDTERGWGRAGETWEALESARSWGGEGWFMLGDRDIGLHLVRTQALRAGEPLSAVTARLAEAVGIRSRLVPATDDRVRTHLATPAGTFSFQEWFVARGHRDEVDEVQFVGAATATPAPGALEALAAADVIVIAPSNPYVSIHPILAVAEIHEAVASRNVRCVAVSPLIGGLAVRGPLDRMLRRMAGGTTPEHVTDCYKGLVDALVIDRADAPARPPFHSSSPTR